MNVKSIEKQEKSSVKLVIEVGAEEWKPALEKAYRKKRGSFSVPGFRKGKAPKKIIETMYGPSVFYEEAINETYFAAYMEAVRQNNVDVVAFPQVDIDDVNENGYTFTAIVAVRPEVKLGKYKGVKAEVNLTEVTEEMVDAEVKSYARRAQRLETVDRALEQGDTAVIDYEGFDNGEPFAGGKSENYNLEIGSGRFIPGFEEQLIGMKAGEHREITVTFPSNYAKEMADKTVIFKVDLHEVKHPVLPEIDDELAKDVSEFDTLAEFREDLRKKLEGFFGRQNDIERENAVLSTLVAETEIEVPEAMIQEEAQKVADEYNNQLQQQGQSLERYMAMTGMQPDDFRKTMMDAAEQRVKSRLTLEEVAKAEKMELTDEEVDAALEEMGKEYAMSAEELRKLIDLDQFKEDQMLKKASNFILEHAKVTAAKKETVKKSASKAKEKDAPAAKKTTAKKSTKKAEEAAEKTTVKKTASKAKKDAETEEKKPAAKKATTKKAAATTEKKPAAKKSTAKKAEEK